MNSDSIWANSLVQCNKQQKKFILEYLKYCLGYTYTKQICIVYMKLKFNWVLVFLLLLLLLNLATPEGRHWGKGFEKIHIVWAWVCCILGVCLGKGREGLGKNILGNWTGLCCRKSLMGKLRGFTHKIIIIISAEVNPGFHVLPRRRVPSCSCHQDLSERHGERNSRMWQDSWVPLLWSVTVILGNSFKSALSNFLHLSNGAYFILLFY